MLSFGQWKLFDFQAKRANQGESEFRLSAVLQTIYPPPAQYKSEFSVSSWSFFEIAWERSSPVFSRRKKKCVCVGHQFRGASPVTYHQSLSLFSHAQLSSLSLARRWLVRFPPTHSPVCDEWAVRESPRARNETKNYLHNQHTVTLFFSHASRQKKRVLFFEPKLEKFQKS